MELQREPVRKSGRFRTSQAEHPLPTHKPSSYCLGGGRARDETLPATVSHTCYSQRPACTCSMKDGLTLQGVVSFLQKFCLHFYIYCVYNLVTLLWLFINRVSDVSMLISRNQKHRFLKVKAYCYIVFSKLQAGKKFLWLNFIRVSIKYMISNSVTPQSWIRFAYQQCWT